MDEEYNLAIDGLVKSKIYVPNSNELKNLILRELHDKLYSCHPGYQKTLIAINKFYC